MAALRLVLFDRAEIYLDGKPIHASLPDKAIALLCYLAVTRTPHHRSRLAGLLWGNKVEKRARNNLSIVLNKLGRMSDFLTITRREVGWNLNSDYEIDVCEFERCATRLGERSLVEMQHSADLYRAALLYNFRIADEDGARNFLEWLQNQQTRLEKLARNLFHTLAVQHLEANNIQSAIVAAKREADLDPWREEAHRQLMRLYDHAGQREQAVAQFKRCLQILQDELGVGVSAETQQLYDNIIAGTSKPLRTISTDPPFEAPALPTHFVGRTTLAATIRERLDAFNRPICALVGMGGIGKTTLATFLAHEWCADFPDGVLWAHAEDEDLLHILGRWGERLGRDLAHLKSVENRAVVLRDLLIEKRALLVLDNVDRAEALRALIPASGDSLIVLTTRLHDIASALDALALPIDVLSREDGVALLTEVIGEGRVSAELTAAHTICEQLECLPLALEIIAQRLRARPYYLLETLVAQLEQLQSRLSALQVGDRAVRVSFEVSWGMLSEQLQEAFCALAVFEGKSFSADAFAALLTHSLPFSAATLSDLVALSLLTPLDGQRYRQHALLADFAFEKAPNLSIYQERMIAHFTAFATQHADDPNFLQTDWHNLLSVVHTAHARADWQQTLALVNAVTPTFSKLGHYNDARTILPLARTAAQYLCDPLNEAYILHNWGAVCIEQNDYEEAQSLLEAAYELVDDPLFVSDVMLDLARLAIERGIYEDAHQWLIEAQEIKQKLADERGLGLVHYRLARLCLRNGALESAENHCKSATKKLKTTSPAYFVRTLQTYATILVQMRQLDLANTICQEALQTASQLNNTDLMASVLYISLICAIRADNYEKAKMLAEKCITTYSMMGATKDEGLVYYELSNLERKRNQPEIALQRVEQSIHLFRQVDAVFSLVYALWQRGIILKELNRIQDARRAWQDTLEHARSVRHPKTALIQSQLAQF